MKLRRPGRRRAVAAGVMEGAEKRNVTLQKFEMEPFVPSVGEKRPNLRQSIVSSLLDERVFVVRTAPVRESRNLIIGGAALFLDVTEKHHEAEALRTAHA